RLPAERPAADRRLPLLRGALRARHRAERGGDPRARRRLADAGDGSFAAHRLRPRRGDREEGAQGRHDPEGSGGRPRLCQRRGLRPLGASRGDDPPRMKRRDFLLALALSPALPARGEARFERGLLWEVNRKGAAPSHVYGTIHVADARLEKLPGPVQAAFARAASLMLEFVPDEYVNERFLEAAMFTDRQTLQEKIGAEDFERALAQLRPIGLSREFVDKLKPWGVLINLRDPRAAGGLTPDARLAAQARARRMPVFR